MKITTMDDKTIWGWVGAIAALMTALILYLNYKNQREHNQSQQELIKIQKEIAELQKEKLKNGK